MGDRHERYAHQVRVGLGLDYESSKDRAGRMVEHHANPVTKRPPEREGTWQPRHPEAERSWNDGEIDVPDVDVDSKQSPRAWLRRPR